MRPSSHITLSAVRQSGAEVTSSSRTRRASVPPAASSAHVREKDPLFSPIPTRKPPLLPDPQQSRTAPSLRCGNTGYTLVMAKVMISLPDDLLARVDTEAQRCHTSRSAMLRRFADQALEEQGRRLAEEMKRLNQAAVGHGGDVVSELKSGRPQ